MSRGVQELGGAMQIWAGSAQQVLKGRSVLSLIVMAVFKLICFSRADNLS